MTVTHNVPRLAEHRTRERVDMAEEMTSEARRAFLAAELLGGE
jgi:hypothetical protein